VNAKEFEQAVLELAMTTRAPLSRANISFYTGVPARQAEKWLDELLRDAIVEIDTDDDGEIVYNVTGAKRPEQGATSLTRCAACQRVTGTGSRCGHCGEYLDNRLRALKAEVERERGSSLTPAVRRSSQAGRGTGREDKRADGAGALRPLDMARMLSDFERFRRDLGKPAVADEKNIIVAGVLGLFGPLGWFYAGSQREAGIALVAVLIAAKLLPIFIFAPLLTLLAPLSALVSVLYAWQYNRTGERTSLFLEPPKSGNAGDSDDDSDRDSGAGRRRRSGRR
jgi:hypothetical protein